MLRGVLPLAQERGIRLITNAGGINPVGVAAEVLRVVRELGIFGLKVAVVSGDSVLHRLDGLAALPTLEDGTTPAEWREQPEAVCEEYIGYDSLHDPLATATRAIA